MSQNNDWLTYEKSGSCRTDSLQHAFPSGNKISNIRDKVKQTAKEKYGNSKPSNPVTAIQNGIALQTFKLGVEYLESIERNMNKVWSRMSNDLSQLRNAYSHKRKSDFLSLLGRVYKDEKEFQDQYKLYDIDSNPALKKYSDVLNNAQETLPNNSTVKNLRIRGDNAETKIKKYIFDHLLDYPGSDLIDNWRKELGIK